MYKAATRLTLAIGLAGALLSAPAPVFADQRSNIAVIGMTSEPATLDPAAGFSGFDYPYLYSIYDRLIDFDPKTLELRPGLAESWEFVGPDKKALQLKLRPGVKFQDGTPLDAEAVKTSLLHFKEIGRRDDLDIVTSVDVVDPLTVRINLSKEYSVLPGVLSDRAGMIVSPTALQKYGKEFSRNPVGAGPFSFGQWKSGTTIELKKFDDYWNKDAVKLSGVTYRIITNPTSLVSALVAGQLDQASGIDPKNLPVLKANPRLRIQPEPTLFYYALQLNLATPPTDNVLVRRALNMAIDREALVKAILGPGAEAGEGPALMMVPPSSWAYTPELANSVKYDPEKAKELLKQAGYPDGVTIKICGTPILGYGADIIDIEREQMKKAGITLEGTMLAGSACLQSWQQNTEYPIRQGGFTGRPDPYLTYFQNYGSSGGNNRGRVKFPGVDEDLEAILQTYDREGQNKIYDRLNQSHIDNAPAILLFYGSNIAAYSKDLAGEQPNAQGKTNPVTWYFKK